MRSIDVSDLGDTSNSLTSTASEGPLDWAKMFPGGVANATLAVSASLSAGVNWLSWVVSLGREVADEDLDVLLFLNDTSSDFLNQVGESATNLGGLSPDDLGVDVSFLGGHGELVDEGKVNLVATAFKGGKGGILVEFGERAVGGHTEDDFRDVQVVLVLDVHSVNALFSPFLSSKFKGGIPLELVHV